MNIKDQLDAALKRAQDLTKVSSERDLTDEELTEVKSLTENIDGLKAQVKKADDDAALMKRLGEHGKAQAKQAEEADDAPRTLGEHFIKHAGTRLKEIRGVAGATVSAPEFKANTDNQVTSGGIFAPVLTEVDRTIVQAVRTRLTIADLLSSGTISGNAISYFVEGAVEGAFTTVAEAGAKPQLHMVDPTTVTDSLKKIAAFIKMTDEMTEDLSFYVSEINNRLLYLLGVFEEQQVLNGAGTGSTVTGILLRSGIQTETGASLADNADAVFRSITKVSTGSGLDADGIVIHPTDYQAFRLKKDANSQYYGGGFFAGEYGVGGVPMQPPLWGLPTVVTPAIAAGTVLVGSFKQAATLYRKGGVRVESTNSHASDFTSNLVTTRAEERVALAVRVPTAFVKLTLGTS